MRLAVAAILCTALLAGCGEDDEQPAAPAEPAAALAQLSVEVDSDGPEGQVPDTATIRCETPEDSATCAELDALDAAVFAPTPDGVACTQQYGGPEIATVKGTFRGEPVDATFTRTNGCEIARWEDAAPVLEAATP